MKKSALSFFVFAFVVTLSSCKVNKEAEENATAQAAVLSYLVVEQAGIQSDFFKAAFSNAFGSAMVATSDSTFQNWISPPRGCMLAGSDGVQVKPTRNLDVGNAYIRNSNGIEIVAEKDSKDFSFSLLSRYLNPGLNAYRTSGSPDGSFRMDQTFYVLPEVFNMVLQSETGEIEQLPAPAIPSEPTSPSDDPHNFYVFMNRSKGYELRYVAPENTSYVRVTVSDGSSAASLNVVCYAEASGSVVIPRGALSHFRATTDALLLIDFVNISVRKDLPRVKESVVVSYKRHYHGRRDVQMEDGLQTNYLGALILE